MYTWAKISSAMLHLMSKSKAKCIKGVLLPTYTYTCNVYCQALLDRGAQRIQTHIRTKVEVEVTHANKERKSAMDSRSTYRRYSYMYTSKCNGFACSAMGDIYIVYRLVPRFLPFNMCTCGSRALRPTLCISIFLLNFLLLFLKHVLLFTKIRFYLQRDCYAISDAVHYHLIQFMNYNK